MTSDRLINILVTITLVEMMMTIGLGVKFADIAHVVMNGRLLARTAIANYLCVPAVTVGLLLTFQSPPMVTAGFLIVAVCPGAPYGPPLTALAKGNASLAVGLMVVLAGSSAILAPLLLRFLLPLMAGSQPLRVDAVKMIRTLAVTQLLPLGAGLLVRQRRQALADRLKQPFDRGSTLLNLCTFGLILLIHFSTLAAIRLGAYGGMLALVTISLATGWLLGESGSGNRKSMGFSTSVRNVAVSLVIATSSFPDTPAVTAALAYGIFQTIVLASVALAWGWFEPITHPVIGENVVPTRGPDQRV